MALFVVVCESNDLKICCFWKSSLFPEQIRSFIWLLWCDWSSRSVVWSSECLVSAVRVEKN